MVAQKSIDNTSCQSLLPVTNARLRNVQSSRSFRNCFGTMHTSNIIPVNQSNDPSAINTIGINNSPESSQSKKY